MDINEEDVTPVVTQDPVIVEGVSSSALKNLHPSSVLSDIIQVKLGSSILENGKITSSTQINEEFFRRYPEGMKIVTNDNKNGPFFLKNEVKGAAINNPKMIKIVFSVLAPPIMNYGSNVVDDPYDNKNRTFFREYQYFKVKDSIIMYNKESISSKNDENSYMFHRLSSKMYTNFINSMVQSDYNCLVAVCIFSEIRNYMKFTFKDGYEYSSGKPRAWFCPKTYDYNPSTLPSFLMDEVFNFNHYYKLNTPDYEEFCYRFKTNMEFEFTENWVIYKDYICKDYVSSNDGSHTHTSLSNVFFNKYIINMEVCPIHSPSGENIPPYGFMPYLSIFKPFFSGKKNNRMENELITFDDVPFIFLKDLFEIADFGPLPGSIPLFMSVCCSNADHLFKFGTNRDPVPLKDRLPIAIKFYRGFLDTSYVSTIIKKVLPMSKSEFHAFQKDECNVFIESLEKGKFKMEVQDVSPNENLEPVECFQKKSYKDIAESSNKNKENEEDILESKEDIGSKLEEEESVHHLPSGITTPSSPEKRAMNIEAPPFTSPGPVPQLPHHLSGPPPHVHHMNGHHPPYGVYVPPGAPIMPQPIMVSPPVQTTTSPDNTPTEYMEVTLKIKTNVLAHWIAMFTERGVPFTCSPSP